MKKNFKIFIVLIAVTTLLFFITQCSGSEEKAQGKKDEPQKQADARKDHPKKQKSGLPKKLLNLDLTAEQKAKCETLYKEIFTPEILAERSEVAKKLKGLKKDSAEFIKLKKELGEKMKPFNAKFNEKLKEILTPGQQEQYFKKTEK